MSVVFLADGKLLAVSDGLKEGGVVKIWNYRDRKLISCLPRSESAIWCIAKTADGELLATGSDEIVLWDAKTFAPKHKLGTYEVSGNCVVFSPNGKLLASGGLDKAIRLWEVNESGLSPKMYRQK